MLKNQTSFVMKKSDKNKVYKTYDEIITWFDDHRSKDLVKEKFYLEYLQGKIPVDADILDVGCGTGEPIAKYFIEKGYKIIGIDVSKKMIELCKKRFPKNQWVVADMRQLNLQKQFDLVIVWHSLFHLTHDDQRSTLKLLSSLVKPFGLLVFTSGSEHSEEWSENAGHNLYHASLSKEEYEKILYDNELSIMLHKIKDPDCGFATIWIAKKSETRVFTPHLS